MESLHDRIGSETLQKVITEFYIRAFQDPIIGHFFFHHDREKLTAMQISFATSMLGGKGCYRGRPLKAVHQDLPIRPPHFRRRQILMREVLEEQNVPAPLAEAWLEMENQLRPLILKG